MPNVKSILATGMFAIGAVILGYAFLFSGPEGDVPGWEPVNERLHAALASEPPASQSQRPETPMQPKGTAPTQSPPSTAASTDEPTTEKSTDDPTIAAPSDEPATAKLTAVDPTTEPPTAPVASPTPAAAASLLNLNTATQVQLENLPGIGPSKAKAIIAYREQHGAYKSVKDLLKVKGIGPKMLEKLTAHVTAQAAN